MSTSKNTEELKNELGTLIWRMATNLVHGGKVSSVQFMDYMLESVRDLNFTTCIESGLDVFGICYEHLIKMNTLNSGTKGGEFYMCR